MKINPERKQLIWTAGLICLLILLLGLSMMLLASNYFADDNIEIEPNDEIIIYITAILACWGVNLGLRLFPEPQHKSKRLSKWLINYVLSYLLYLVVAYAVWQLLFLELFNLGQKQLPLPEVLTINSFVILLIEVILYRYEHENAKLEIANYRISFLQSQQEKLKHQLHPHFLFNSLNALKVLIKRNNLEAESYLIMLSEFLRFSISHNEQNLVSLQEELKFCHYYLEMQKVRFKDAFIFEIDVPEEIVTKMQLPVFSLQLLLENAIKHNALTAANPLRISISFGSNDCLLVKNTLTPRMHLESSEGIGLKNLSERYRLLIDQDIKVEVNEEHFMVYIKTVPI